MLIACRDFDLNKDSRFKEFVKKYEKDVHKIFINNLSNETVTQALIKLGVNKKRINEKLVKLFSIPLHIQMLCAVSESAEIRNLNYENKLELYNAFWDVKSAVIGDEYWYNILNLMINYLNKNKVLIAPQCIFDIYKTSLNKLLSECVFCQDRLNITFFHETFYDYCFARILAANPEKSLTDFILSSDQSLFIRSNVRQSLEYLRFADYKRYLNELEQILNNENIRVHIRTLILDILLNFEKLANDEIKILVNLQGTIKDAILNKSEYKQAEFLIQYNTGKLFKNLIDGDVEKFNQAASFLIMFVDKYTDEVDNIITKLSDEKIINIMLLNSSNSLSSFLYSPYIYKNPRLYNILKILLWNKTLNIKYFLDNLQCVMKDFITPKQVFELYEILLDTVIQESVNKKNRFDNFAYINIYKIDDYIKEEPDLFLDITLKHLLRGFEQTKSYSYNGLTHNSLCSFSLYGYEDNLLKIFNNAFYAYAQQEPANYWYYIQDYKNSDYETILFLILKSMYFLPLEYSDKVIDYIINTPHLYYVGYNSDSSYLTTVLLNKFTQKCSEDLLKKLIKQILNYKDNHEYEYFKRLKINKSLERI